MATLSVSQKPRRKSLKCVRCQSDELSDSRLVNGEIMCGYCAHMWAKGESE
jgi:cytochrome c-type biogenesis protein CcmH/NrfF